MACQELATFSSRTNFDRIFFFAFFLIGIHGRRPLVGEDFKSVASIGRLVSMSVAPSNLLKIFFLQEGHF